MSADTDRRVAAGRALAAIAVARRAPTFDDLLRGLRGVSRAELARALADLLARGLIAEDRYPSALRPLFDPPIICYRPVALHDGRSLTSKAGD